MLYVYLSEHIYFRLFRWAVYRQFTSWVHGKLCQRVRRVLPACASHLIKTRFHALAAEQHERYHSALED